MDVNDSLTLLATLMLSIFGLRMLTTRPVPAGWAAVLLAIGLTLLSGWFLFPELVGWVSASALFLFVLCPIVAQRQAVRFAMRGWTRTARFLASLSVLTHPADGWFDTLPLVRALVLLQRGQRDEALALLDSLAHTSRKFASIARSLHVRATGRWSEFLTWIQTRPDPHRVLGDRDLLDLYLQSLAESRQVPRMISEYHRLVGRAPLPQAQLRLCAFCGQLDSVESLLAAPLRTWPRTTRSLWQATALQAAGRPEEARPLLEELATHRNPLISQPAQDRIAFPVEPANGLVTAGPAAALLQAVKADIAHDARFAALTSVPHRRTVVTLLIVAALTINFAREIPGGTDNIDNLIDMGAVVILNLPPELEHLQPQLPNQEWWRPLTAAFLHFGPAHYLMNLVALLFLGRRLERAWGWWPTLVCFLLAAVGSMMGTPYLLTALHGETQVLAGASGGIMGLLGGLLAHLFVGSRRRSTPHVDRQFRLLLAFILLETMFDLLHPHVSYEAHLIGLLIGSGWGALYVPIAFRPRAARVTPATQPA